MSVEQLKRLAKIRAQQREWFTLAGFVAALAGLWLGWGLAVALVIGGTIVFGCGLFGMLRK